MVETRELKVLVNRTKYYNLCHWVWGVYNLKPDIAYLQSAKIFLNQIDYEDLYIFLNLSVAGWLHISDKEGCDGSMAGCGGSRGNLEPAIKVNSQLLRLILFLPSSIPWVYSCTIHVNRSISFYTLFKNPSLNQKFNLTPYLNTSCHLQTTISLHPKNNWWEYL